MHRVPRRRLVPATAGVVCGAVLLLTGAGCGPTDPVPSAAGGGPAASTGAASTRLAGTASERSATPASPAVGALFRPNDTRHFCTGAVVDSPSGDVVLTAAHCLSGTGAGLRFVPGYGAFGDGPAGTWTVTGAYADAAWLSGQDIRHDYAFLTVAPAAGAAAGRAVQAAVGAAGRLTASSAVPGPVELFGYDNGSNDQQVTCSTDVTDTPDGGTGSPTVACPGFRAGTSGAPWIRRTSGGDQLVGLVGGLHQGGCSDDVSHSPALDAAVTGVLDRASAGGPPDTLPVPDDDGC